MSLNLLQALNNLHLGASSPSDVGNNRFKLQGTLPISFGDDDDISAYVYHYMNDRSPVPTTLYILSMPDMIVEESEERDNPLAPLTLPQCLAAILAEAGKRLSDLGLPEQAVDENVQIWTEVLPFPHQLPPFHEEPVHPQQSSHSPQSQIFHTLVTFIRDHDVHLFSVEGKPGQGKIFLLTDVRLPIFLSIQRRPLTFTVLRTPIT